MNSFHFTISYSFELLGVYNGLDNIFFICFLWGNHGVMIEFVGFSS